MTIRKISLPQPQRGDISSFDALPWQGNPRAKIMIVVDPIILKSKGDIHTNRPMSTHILNQLAPFMKDAGIKGEDCVFISASTPVTDVVWKSDSQLSRHLKEENPKFREAFARLKPQLIISQGKAAIRQVTNKAAKITKMRGVAFRDPLLKVIVMPTLGIGHVLRIPEHGEVFLADLQTASRIATRGFKLEEEKYPRDYKWVTDLQFLIDAKPKLISVDTETSCYGTASFASWYLKETKVLTVQLTVKPGQSFVVPIEYSGHPVDPGTRTKLIAQLKVLLENKETRIIGQNFKYDYLILFKKLNIRVGHYSDDILLMTHMLNENMLSKALDDVARVYLPQKAGYKDEFRRKGYDMGRMDLVPPEDILEYSGGDSDCVFQLYHILVSKMMEDKKLYNCYLKVVMPAMRAFCEIEQQGIKVNRDALEALRKKVQAKQTSEYNRLLRMIPREIRDEYEHTGVGLKLTRDALLRAYLFTHPKGLKLTPTQFTVGTREPSISSKTHLPYFIGKHNFIYEVVKGSDGEKIERGIIPYIKNEKLLTTYIGRDRHISEGESVKPTGFWQYIHDDLIRPSYHLHRTTTGRSASSDPNGQNFPQRGEFAREYRSIFEAPKGWTLIEADYSQLELRIAGITANEPLFLKTYREGGDIHCLTAATVMGIGLEDFMRLKDTDPEKYGLNRFRAKAVNFGFIYGMGWKKFRIYAKTDYGIDYSDDEAQDIRSKFFGKYTALASWHEGVRNFVRDRGYVRCFDGRVRHLPAILADDDSVRSTAERQAINSPIQGFGSDLGLMALARINASVPKNLLRIIGFIHDSIIAVAKEGQEMMAARMIKQYMENNPTSEWFGFVSPIPIIADIKIGKNLAKMVEVKDFSVQVPAPLKIKPPPKRS